MGGSARNWLLLRGLTREQRHWSGFPGLFSDALGAEVLCLDLPGVGTEADRGSPGRIRGIVSDLRTRWRTHARDEPWGLLAVSLGGMVALDWIARHPEDFARAVVINSSAANTSFPHHRMRPRILPGLLRSMKDDDPIRKERTVVETITNHHHENDALIEEWAEVARESPVRPDVARNQVRAAMTFFAPRRIRTPTLFLTADNDRLVSARCSERLAGRYRAPLHTHPTAGHDLPVDDPHWVIERVKEWNASSIA